MPKMMWFVFQIQKTCIQRPPKESDKSGILQQVVFNSLPHDPDF